MEWLYYLLEANLYLLIFYGFYRLFLQNETFYNSNRYYLLVASLIAFLLPILQLGLLKPALIPDHLALELPLAQVQEEVLVAAVPEAFNFMAYLYPLYLYIALGFGIKLSIDLSKIVRLWLKAKKLRTGAITLVELQDQTAFSFFNLLFIHPHLAEKQTVLNHEMVHIKQKHSFDILFFELLQIVCWFNPIIYFIKKDIKLLHEYIADELSTTSGMQKHEYAMFLIENSFGLTPTNLTNQIFNQSILKKRINMLNKKRTVGWARLKLLVALPLTGGMLCMSTMAFTKDYGYVDLLPEKSIPTLSMIQDPVKAQDVKKLAPVKAENIKKQDPVKVKNVKKASRPPKVGPVKKDSIRIVNIKALNDTPEVINIKLKPLNTIELKQVKPLKLNAIAPVDVKPIKSVKLIPETQLKLNVVSEVQLTAVKVKPITSLKLNPVTRKMDTVKLTLYNEVKVKPERTRNLQIKRDSSLNLNRVNLNRSANRAVNRQVTRTVDSVVRINVRKATQVEIKKDTGPKKEIKQ